MGICIMNLKVYNREENGFAVPRFFFISITQTVVKMSGLTLPNCLRFCTSAKISSTISVPCIIRQTNPNHLIRWISMFIGLTEIRRLNNIQKVTNISIDRA